MRVDYLSFFYKEHVMIDEVGLDTGTAFGTIDRSWESPTIEAPISPPVDEVVPSLQLSYRKLRGFTMD